MAAGVKPVVSTPDPDVVVPAAVRRQLELADQFYQKPEEQPAEAQNAPVEVQEQPAEQPAEQPVERVVSETTTHVTQPDSQPEPVEEDENWQRRFYRMKGRFDQMNEANRQLSQQVADLRGLISELRSPPPQTQQQPITPDEMISPKEVEEYGEDFLKVVGKKARAELQPIIRQYQDEIANLKAQLENVSGHVVKTSRQQMFSDLGREVPNWRDINRSEEFINWLQLPDAYSGAIRHDMLKDAFNRNDTKRVAAFFNGFLTEEATTRPPRVQTEQPPPSPAPAKMDLKDLAAPGRAKSAQGTNAPAEKPIITRTFIANFYRDVSDGKFRGRDAEAAKIEKSIFDAQREGRIR